MHATILDVTPDTLASPPDNKPHVSEYMISKMAMVKTLGNLTVGNPSIVVAGVYPGMVHPKWFRKSNATPMVSLDPGEFVYTSSPNRMKCPVCILSPPLKLYD